MEMIYILGLVLGLAVLILMGFKGWGMVPTSIVASLVVIITNRMDLSGGHQPALRHLYEKLRRQLSDALLPGHPVRRYHGQQRCGQGHRL